MILEKMSDMLHMSFKLEKCEVDPWRLPWEGRGRFVLHEYVIFRSRQIQQSCLVFS